MSFPEPKEGIGLNVIAIDLDGTLCHATYPRPALGRAIEEGIEAVKYYAEKGYEVIVFTARPASHKDKIWKWLKRQGISGLVYDVVTDKPRAALYIDDRAVRFPFADN